MKRGFTTLLTTAIALVTLLNITSCSEETNVYEEWSQVYPGVDIYNRVITTNRIATDGVGVALKLAVLLEQAQLENITLTNGSDIAWSSMQNFTLPYNEVEYNLKEFLFGEDQKSSIVKSGDIYRVYFGVDSTFTSGYALDKLYRSGCYQIDTKGINLIETDSSNVWSITLATDNGMQFAESEQSSASIQSKSLNSAIWHDDNGVFSYYSTDYQAAYIIEDATYSLWNTYGSLKCDNFTDLTTDNILDTKLYHTVDSSTQGITLTGKDITYATGGVNYDVTPFVYQPFVTLLYVIEGLEEAQFDGEYNTEDYPSPYVMVEWLNDAPTIHYNDNIFQY